MRIGLFILTNLGVLALASVTLNLLGVGQILNESGTGLDLANLLIFCAVFGFSGAFISLFLSKFMAKRGTGTNIIATPRTADEKWLIATVADLAERARIGMPEVGIFPANQANAFATGWNRNKALVAVSAGLLQRFDREEARAVLAHEIGHVANGDMITLTLIQGVVNTFVMFFARIIGYTIDKAVFKTERGVGIGYYIVTFIAEILLAFIASMIVMAFSRYREYRADHAGATLASREGMIRALERLKAETQAGASTPMPKSMQALGISSGWHKTAGKLFASHPPLDERIAALKNHA